MEGAGSRVGRASSRYGQQAPCSTPAKFSGPVRRWEKKWVHVTSLQRSRPSITRHQRSNPTPGPTQHPKTGPGVLLCKWTPLPEPDSDPPSSAADDPPTRKFRYTPIAVLEEKKREGVKMVVHKRAKLREEVEAKKGQASDDDSYDGLLNINQGLVEAEQHQVRKEGFSTPQPHFRTSLNLEIPLNAQGDGPDPGWSSP